MGQILTEDRDLHFVHRLEHLLAHFVKVVLFLRDCFQDLIDEILVVLVQLADSLNLADDILLSQKLEEPIIALLLDDLDLANVFHVGVHSDPEHRVVVELFSEDVFRLMREVFELKLIHFEFLNVLVEHDLRCLACCCIVITLSTEAVPTTKWIRPVRHWSPWLRVV